MSATALVRLGTVLFIGVSAALVGYAARDAEEVSYNKPETPETLVKMLRAEGMRLTTNDTIPTEGTKIGQHITSLYRGLYLLGRTGARLQSKTQESVARNLGHYHHQCKPRRDRNLVVWYETVGVSSEHQLADLLANCPLSEMFDTRYIAYAMGEDVPNLNFEKLEEEVATHFRT